VLERAGSREPANRGLAHTVGDGLHGHSPVIWRGFSFWNQPPRSELSRCGSPKTLLPPMPLAPLRRSFSSRFGAFEEPPRMSSEREACLRKADEAKQRATQATEPSIKSAYEKVAEHWMLLARLESLVAAEKNSEDV
jgi:hypothetical protein